MIKATHNQYVDININLVDDTTVPIVKLGNNLEIPTIPFIWHREESLNIPIHAIIKISNESMKDIIKSNCNYNDTDSIKNLLLNNIEESYIVNQRTILEKVNYYISYHGIAYRQNISENVICEEIPNKYNKSTHFKSVLYPLINNDTIFSPSKKSPLYKIATGDAFIHNRAFSPPGCFHFKIKESSPNFVFIVHGINMSNKKTVTVLFIMVNDHYIEENKKVLIGQNESIKEFTEKFIANIIDISVHNTVNNIIKKSINGEFISILENNFNKELGNEINTIKSLHS